MSDINFNNAELKITAGDRKQFPADGLPMIAFAGRSNVGKSSLINSLLNRKSLARVSSSPGKTITINYYLLDRKIYLVDLPGYGYAKRSFSEKQKWSKLTDSFFTKNDMIRNLKLVLCLVDSRIGPTDDDYDMMEYLIECSLPFSIVVTKTDKINATRKNEIKEFLLGDEICKNALSVVLYSSPKNTGREELREIISNLE